MADESQPPPNRKPPPIKRPSTAPYAGDGGTIDVDPTVIPDFARQSLLGRGIDVARLAWYMPCTSITLGSGRIMDGGVLAASRDGMLHLFRYTAKDGFQMASVPESAVAIAAQRRRGAISLRLELPSDSSVRSCECQLDGKAMDASRGDWTAFWKDELGKVLGGSVGELLSLRLEQIQPEDGAIGRKVTMSGTDLASVTDEAIQFISSGFTLAFKQVHQWRSSIDRLEIATVADGIPELLRLMTPGRKLADATQSIARRLSPEAATQQDLARRFDAMGKFEIVSEDRAQTAFAAIQIDGATASLYGSKPEQSFTHAYTCRNRLVLATESGSTLCLNLTQPERSEWIGKLKPITSLLHDASGAPWIPLLEQNSRSGVTRLDVAPTGILCGSDVFQLKDAEIKVEEDVSSDFKLVLKSPSSSRTFHGPEALIYALWSEWDARKTAMGLANAGLVDLYTQYNTVKRHNFLLLLFGDIIMLNRSLDADMSMNDLIGSIEELGPVQFAENDSLRNATVSKILLLVTTLPVIKQKFELLAALGPYYWAQLEVDWVAKAFGSGAGKSVSASERKRIVPQVRRQVRAIQGDLLRSLSQIEAASKPIESILAKDELEKHWSTKVRRYAPVAAQLAIGGSFLIMPGGAAMGTRMLAGAFATHALGGVLGYFQKDREAAAQVQKAAEVIFPWWQVFMKTLVVAIYESAEFADGENARSMKRDRELLNTVPADKQAKHRDHLQAVLRRRIVQERKNRFSEVLEGSGIRYQNLLEDLDGAAERGIRDSISNFAGGLLTTGGTP